MAEAGDDALGRKSQLGRMTAIISQLPFYPNLFSILRSPILEVLLLSAPLQPLPSFSLFLSFVTANAEFFVHKIENNLNTHWPLAEGTNACALRCCILWSIGSSYRRRCIRKVLGTL